MDRKTMNDNITYFFDTNIIIIYLYERSTEQGKKLIELINKLRFKKVNTLSTNLVEIDTIINDGFTIFSHIIIENVMKNWDTKNTRERIALLEGIENKFSDFYENIRTKYYKGNILPSGVREKIAKNFFRNIKDKILVSSEDELKRRYTSREYYNDLKDYMSSINLFIKNNFNIVNLDVLFTNSIIFETQLIEEGIRKYINSSGHKRLSRFDQIIFKELYILLSLNKYEKIYFITNDSDFNRLYSSIIKYLGDFKNKKADPRENFKEYAIKSYDILSNRLEISNLSNAYNIFK
ncbi:hypothetical protein [Caldisphaera sp.]|uniref:hypothetical protein n=1 Tax=Caldisphaera sp. TaxID=2060322 RepID=UPI0025C2955D|nr:hypothetical protein [Caldisphaera sp.]